MRTTSADEPKKLAQTVVKISEILSAQQKELLYLVAIVQAFYGCMIEKEPVLKRCFEAKDALSRKNPGEAMQALAESCRQLSETARQLKEHYGPWDN
jgi:hypothetical protein